MSERQELTGKLALVTGGGRGIGRAIVLELARRGADLLINYVRHPDAAEQTALEARHLGVRAETLRGNVADAKKVNELFDQVRDKYGYLDVLINNSASGVNRPATELTAHHWDWTLNVNARGAWLCAQAALPLMRARGGGAVVNISSLGASRVMREYFLVGVSKAALEAVTRYLARDLGSHGIRVNCVSAGPIRTMAAKGIPGFQDLADVWGTRAPLAWDVTNPDPVARAVAFLLSDWASGITGEIVHVDGGYHAMGADIRESP